LSILVEGHVAAHLRGFIDHHACGDAKVHGSQADLHAFDLAEPAFALGLREMRAMRLSQISSSRPRWAGSGWNGGSL
jgi:hypothetical protein